MLLLLSSDTSSRPGPPPNKTRRTNVTPAPPSGQVDSYMK